MATEFNEISHQIGLKMFGKVRLQEYSEENIDFLGIWRVWMVQLKDKTNITGVL